MAIAVEVTSSPRDGLRERAELLGAAVEPGETVRATHRSTATFAPDGSRGSVSRYLRCERLDLKPGRYQLRLGVQSSWAQATGSVFVDVTVPDFRNDVLSMSGLALDQRSGAGSIPVARANVITPLLSHLPSLVRHFGPAGTVWLHVEVYRGAKAPSAAVEVVTSLGREGEAEAEAVWHVRESFPPSVFGTENRLVYRVPLPIATLAPGTYRLRFTATTAATKVNGVPSTFRREMDIAIVTAPAPVEEDQSN